MLMQSTGQGGTHSSQPVHSGAMMVCICLDAPEIASTGQACRHSVQPMQRFSLMKAIDGGLSATFLSKGLNLMPSKFANSRIPSSPPGGHLLISASLFAMASA
jgi:hypothetical protein